MNKRYNNFNKGFIGLIALLLGTVIIIIIFFKTDLFSNKKDGRNIIEQSESNINKAEDIKNLLEDKDKANEDYLQ